MLPSQDSPSLYRCDAGITDTQRMMGPVEQCSPPFEGELCLEPNVTPSNMVVVVD